MQKAGLITSAGLPKLQPGAPRARTPGTAVPAASSPAAPPGPLRLTMKNTVRDEIGAPAVVDRGVFQAELDALRAREKAHTREGDAIAAARRRLPMVEVDGATPLIGEHGAVTLLDAFEGRRLLIAYYFMWPP